MFKAWPLKDHVAAISCGIHGGVAVLDLDYAEDSTAGTDANFVMTGSGGIVEIQGTAEGEPFSRGTACSNCWRWPARASANWWRMQKAADRMSASSRGQKIVVATHNRASLRSSRELLAPYGVETVSAGELGIARTRRDREPPSPAMPASRRRPPCKASGLIALSDDSGLCVDALDGDPGVYTADWAGPDATGSAGHARWSRKSCRPGAVTRTAPRRISSAPCASCWPDGEERLYRRPRPRPLWPGRRAGRSATAMIRCSCPRLQLRPSPRWSPPTRTRISHRARAFEKLVR